MGRLVIWMLHIGRSRHPGRGKRFFFYTPGQLSVVWDLAMDSCAQFLAVEHRLIASWARSICHQLRKGCYQSVWAPACQGQVAGGHAGVGVVSLGAAPLALPTFATTEFLEFFKLGRGLRVTLPTGQGGVVHLFVVYRHQGAEDDCW